MRTSCAIAIALITPALAGAQPLVASKWGDQRAPRDHANSARCRWLGAIRAGESPARGGVPGVSTTLVSTGDPANRIDLVVVGDGYTTGELGLYAEHAQRGVDDLFAIAPFDEYAPLFNVHRVDVISNESGVSGDPTSDVSRDTALQMRFWCGGTERLLCLNTLLARQAADNAPEWDQIFAVANSTKYGGAGYPSQEIGTYSGGNSAAPQVAIHELGHALGDLADEYTYGGPSEYTGPEPSARNASIFDADTMDALNVKWSAWLGVDDPGFDGLVDTFEGANYSPLGIYRPSGNSMMRNLGREFNLPSAEGLIIEMWKIVRPIDLHSANSLPVARDAVLEVQTVAPFLEIRWTLDGAPVGEGAALDLSEVDAPIAGAQIEVEVVDPTPLVRDETARELYMTQRVRWTLRGHPADFTADGGVDEQDLAVILALWGDPEADISGDGECDAFDLSILLAAWG